MRLPPRVIELAAMRLRRLLRNIRAAIFHTPYVTLMMLPAADVAYFTMLIVFDAAAVADAIF